MRPAFTAAYLLLLMPNMFVLLQSGNVPSFWPPPQWCYHAVAMVFFWIGSVCVERRALQRHPAA